MNGSFGMKLSKFISVSALAAFTALAIAAPPQVAAAGNKHFCPPGLINKGCMPPGQAKKYRIGYALPGEIHYRTIYNWRDYDLGPPPAGHIYGAVDGDILLIRAATRLVVDAIILGALLN